MLDKINKLIIDSISDPMLISKDGVILDANTCLLNFFSYDSKEELIYSSLESFFDGQINGDFKGALVKDKIEFYCNDILYKAEVSTFSFDEVYNGHILQELNIWDTKINFQEYENRDEIYMVINPEGGRIVEFNKKAQHFYGYSKKDFSSMSISEINCLNEAEVSKAMEEAKTENNNYFYFKHRRVTGEIEEVRVYSRPIEMNNKKLLLSKVIPLVSKNNDSILKEMISKVPLGLVIINSSGNIINANDGFCEMFKYSYPELINRNISNLICKEEDRGFSESILLSVAEGYVVKEELVRYTKYKDKLFVNLTGFILDKSDKSKLMLMYSDYTEKIRKEKEVKVFKDIMSRSSEGISLISKNMKILWKNERFKEILQYDEKDEIELSLNNVLDILLLNKNDLSGGSFENEVYFHNKENRLKVCLVNFKEIDENSDTPYRYFISLYDLTKLREKEKHIYTMSITDDLTGLFNRKYIENYLNLLIKKGKENSFQIAFIDIDEFKLINDSFGHLVGDEVLIKVSEILTKFLSKDKIGRYGGDEFLVVSQRKYSEFIIDINNVTREIEKMIVKDLVYGISTSIGVAFGDKSMGDVESIIRNADRAMYLSKENPGSYITEYKKK
ncbi:MAG: sensor domain-containing diguanylate cyclase [Firmicutes bacterium]|jgi:diguanylate cyclase (GGDEF)-like protein/PAS domain S-box-containing protein|nr:sensor domain-containing diguanylate cyclase [Bacillota bacterium]